MPLYEYDCEHCGTFEVKQKMNDEPLTTHPACGAPVARRISLSTFALKGGGWHADGYGSAGGGSCATGGGGCATGRCG